MEQQGLGLTSVGSRAMRSSVRNWSNGFRWHGRGNTNGMALITVLWGTAILGLILAGLLSSVQTQSRIAHNLTERAKAQALADAAFYLVVDELLKGQSTNSIGPGIWEQSGLADDGTVTVLIEDETGKIDLNQSPPEALYRLFLVLGSSEADARTMTDAISDYRDSDSDERPYGAEDPSYGILGLNHDAKDAPFSIVDELLQVPGISRETFERVAPYLTVYAARRQINVAAAPEPVLLALPYLLPSQVSEILASRDATKNASVRRAWDYAVTISIDAVSTGGGRFRRIAVVSGTGIPTAPYRILAWTSATND